MPDPRDDAVEQVTRALRVELAEAQRVEHRDRAGAEREHVAQDPADPVAAPWNGSTALGWLCDSTLNAATRPPPTSTAPAFSPGPITTLSPSVGKRRSLRECLYAQCSDHISENMASSRSFGSRPRSSRIRSYSESVRPSSR